MRINRLYTTVKAASGESILNIIKMCKLSPVNSWLKWTDYQGHNLIFVRNKFPKITTNLKEKKIITDLHFKSSLNVLLDISDKVYIYDNLIFMYGYDERLRCFNFDGFNCSPLVGGLSLLKKISLSIEDFEVILLDESVREKRPTKQKLWASKWPPSQDFIQEFKKENKEKCQVMELNLMA